jgi:cell division protein ZapE
VSSAITLYKKICSEEQVKYNHKQELLISQLDEFLSHKKKNFILKIFDTSNIRKKKCFYIHGGVGVGKTLIMDLFNGIVKNKQRIHFHKFMIEIHDEFFVYFLQCH